MSLIVLLSATGIGVYEHVCKFSGNKTSSLFDKDSNCCKENKTIDLSSNSFKKATCCKLEKQHLKITTNSDYFSKLKFEKCNDLIIISKESLVSFFTAFKLKEEKVYFSNSSPPFLNQTSQSKLCIFRI
jgi:hypothetical protein